MLMRKHNGFTLFELLVVILVLALTMALVGPMYRGGQRGDLNVFSRSLMADLRLARSIALLKGKPSTVKFDLAEKIYEVAGNRETKRIPDVIRLSLTLDEADISKGQGVIYFYADGSSNGGLIEMSRDGKKLLLTTSWLNGRVSVEEVAS